MENKALKSGIWYTAANFLMKSITFITTPIFSRMLSRTEFGLYSSFTSWLSALTILVTLNLESTFISARYEYERRFDEYIFSVLTLSSLSGGIWLSIAFVFSEQAAEYIGLGSRYLYLMMVYLVALPAVSMFQARERYYYEYKISVFVSLFLTVTNALLSVLLVSVMSDRFAGRVLGGVLPTILVGVVLYVVLGCRGKRVEVSFWKYALPLCLPYIPHLLSLTLLNSMDRMMVTKICGAEDNALYSIAYTCGTIITLLITSMNTAFSPWLGDKLSGGKEDEIREVSKRYVLLFSALAVGIMLLTPEVLLVMGGRAYLDAIYVVPPVMFGCVCQFLYTMFVNIEQFKKKTVGMAFASVSAALMNYFLNSIFIPKYGYIAAAYTTLVSFLWLLLVHMFLVKKLGYLKVYPVKFILLVLIGMGLYTVLVNYLYGFQVIRYLLITIYGGAIFYFGVKYRGRILMLFKEG